MDMNEFNKRYETDGTYRALIGASVQIELCGWCPKAKNNDLDKHFYTCDVAKKDGVSGCHNCIAAHFLTKAKAH